MRPPWRKPARALSAPAKSLLGQGVFIMTVDQGPDMDRYQGVTAIEGETLALCAEQYFAQSEQTPTRVRLAGGSGDQCRRDPLEGRRHADQNIAEDDARGSTAKAWTRTRPFSKPSARIELIDPTLTSEGLLFRLFHEDGVRVFEPKALEGGLPVFRRTDHGVLASFAPEEQADMVEDDGLIRVTCEYCASVYALTPEQLIAAAEA